MNLDLKYPFTVVSGRGQNPRVFNFNPKDYTSLCILNANQLHVANLSVRGFFFFNFLYDVFDEQKFLI